MRPLAEQQAIVLCRAIGEQADALRDASENLGYMVLVFDLDEPRVLASVSVSHDRHALVRMLRDRADVLERKDPN